MSHCAILANPGGVRPAVTEPPSHPKPTQSHGSPNTGVRLADLPPVEVTARMLTAYFANFHVFCPVLDRRSFLDSVDDGTVSTTLLRCVLFVASIHCDMDILHCAGYSTRTDAGDDLFGKASTAFNVDKAISRPILVLCSYLLHYWFGKPTSYQDSAWWLSTAIRSAQFLNYHRDTPERTPSETSDARRVWGCLYVSRLQFYSCLWTELMGQIRDRQVALSLSTPMSINDLDSDIGPPLQRDFDEPSGDTATYVVLQAELNRCGEHRLDRALSRSALILPQLHFCSIVTAPRQDCASP